MTFYLHTVPAKVVDLFIWMIGKEPRQVIVAHDILTIFVRSAGSRSVIHYFIFRLNEFYKRVHAAAKHLSSYQQMHVRYHNHNVINLMNKLSPRDKMLFDFDMSTLSWDAYFDKYLKGLRVYLMGNPLHMPGPNNNTLNRYLPMFTFNNNHGQVTKINYDLGKISIQQNKFLYYGVILIL